MTIDERIDLSRMHTELLLEGYDALEVEEGISLALTAAQARELLRRVVDHREDRRITEAFQQLVETAEEDPSHPQHALAKRLRAAWEANYEARREWREAIPKEERARYFLQDALERGR